MGIFDKIFKSLGRGDNAEDNSDVRAIMSTGGTPLKPQRLYEDFFYDEDDIEINYSFMLSGDFLPSKSHVAEVDFLAVYEPESKSSFGEYDYNKPVFMLVNAAEDEIYTMIDEYKNGNTPKEAMSFKPVSDLGEKVYFSAKIRFNGSILCFYAFDRGLMWENCYMGVMYNEYYMATELENKLLKAVDEAIRTYKEKAAEA